METRTVESELAHFGVKGMRWGIRKKRQVSDAVEKTYSPVGTPAKTTTKDVRGPSPVQVKVVPGKPVQSRGGARQPTVDEAIRSAALKQKLHKSGKQSLTNEEMRFLADRLTLEDRLSKLAPKPKHAGLVWAERFIKSPLPGLGINIARGKLLPKEIGAFTARQVQIEKGLDFAEKFVKSSQAKSKEKKKEKK